MDVSAPYLGYVTTAYAIFAAVLLALLIGVVRRGRRLRDDLKRHNLHDPGSSEGENP